jgi:cytochrome c oxidase assembly protein subunit 15
MIALGGITRLTQSGLSMTNWKFTGSLPPLNDIEWQQEFERYKLSPEYKLINKHFEVADFKQIFWWEFSHRALGRLIGITFLIPLLYFIVRKIINKRFALKCLIALGLIVSQGLLGWLMVKSGLNKIPHVNHFLLAAHLLLAISTLIYIVYLRQSLIHSPDKTEVSKRVRLVAKTTMLLTIVQMILGALVAGLKAGYLYNTFPKMGAHWIPDEVFTASSWLMNGAVVQFLHRIGACTVLIAVYYLLAVSRKDKLPASGLRSMNVLTLLTISQITLGVICILYHVPVAAGVLHQLTAVLMLITIASLVFPPEAKKLSQ